MLSDRFGRLPLGDVLAPAIRIAEEGFPVPEITAAEWAGRRSPAARRRRGRARLPAGRPGAARRARCSGIPISRRPIARSPSDGRDAFYRGDIARRIVSCSDRARRRADRRRPCGIRRRVGRAALDDLPRLDRLRAAAERAGHRRADDAQPARARRRSARTAHNSVEALHTLIEAKKLAYADMARHVADPAFHQRAGGGAAVEGVRRPSARARSIPARAQPRGVAPARCRPTAATPPI